MRGARLQQAVREAAGRGADVEAPTPRRVEPERVEGVAQLDAAARDVGRRRVDAELDVGLDELARLGGARVPGAEADLAGHHRGGGPRAGREQAALRQQGVEADPRHRRNATGCAAAHSHPGRESPPYGRDPIHLPPHPRRSRAGAGARPAGGAVRSRPRAGRARRGVLAGRAPHRAGPGRPDSLPLSTHQPSTSRSSPPSRAAASASASPAIRRPGCSSRASEACSSRSSRSRAGRARRAAQRGARGRTLSDSPPVEPARMTRALSLKRLRFVAPSSFLTR